MKGTAEIKACLAGLDDSDIAFLDGAVLYHQVPEHGIIVVHGGILPGVRSLPQTPYWEMSGSDRKYHGLMMRTRFVDKATGEMLMLGTEKEGDPFWADIYDGRFGKAVFGHSAFLNRYRLPKVFDHALGIDLGCVYGGHLLALVLEEGKAMEYASVPAKAKYASIRDEDA